MSLAQLRRILTTPLGVNVESHSEIVARVSAAAAGRAHLSPKTPAIYEPLTGSTPIQFTALDFLRKIGELTTPKQINLARLSASWATRRYFWAVHSPAGPGGSPPTFSLSRDARAIDRHQKTLLSDEFGMGFAGLVAERLFAAPQFVEVDYAVSNPTQFFGAQASLKRRPDFLMWGEGTPLFVVECKGSQTSLTSVVQQLRRGLEQLPSIDVAPLPRVALAIATHLRPEDTVVYVVDPPDEGPKVRTKRYRVDSTIERRGTRDFVVSNLDGFREKLQVGVELSRLRWAGQHATAEDVVARRFDRPRIRPEVQDGRLDRVETDTGEFLGTAAPLAPELGPGGPRLFRGVRADLLAHVDQAGERPAKVQTAGNLLGRLKEKDPRFSVGANGACLAVLDLEI